MESINKSLIIHSAWNVIINKNPLFTATLKAKYYPHRLGSTRPKAVRPKHSSADPLWPRLVPSFCQVTDMWALGYIPCVYNILRRFCHLVGPWILVMSMWHILIRWGLPLLDWRRGMFAWNPGRSHVAAPYVAEPEMLGSMYAFSLHFLSWVLAFK
jgi:hypothetical protein